MESVTETKKETANLEEGKGKGKQSWGRLFFNFLAYGGIIVVLIVGVIIALVISILIK